jgi:hypothetical protein
MMIGMAMAKITVTLKQDDVRAIRDGRRVVGSPLGRRLSDG